MPNTEKHWGPRARYQSRESRRSRNNDSLFSKIPRNIKLIMLGATGIGTIAAIGHSTSGSNETAPPSPGASASSMGIGESNLLPNKTQRAAFANQYEIIWPSGFNIHDGPDWQAGYKTNGLPIDLLSVPGNKLEFNAGKIHCIIDLEGKNPTMKNPPTLLCAKP